MDFDYLHPEKSLIFYENWRKCSAFISRKIQEKSPDFLKDAAYTTGKNFVVVFYLLQQLNSILTYLDFFQTKSTCKFFST